MKKERTTELSDSILSSVKKLIGIMEDDTSFDVDIILNINAAFVVLYQLGVLKKSYTISSKDDTYQDLIPDGREDTINLIKMYLFYKTKLGFDSSTISNSIIDVLKQMIDETEYRLMISYNSTDTFEDKEDEGGEIQNE